VRATSSPLLSPIGLGLVAGLISGTFGVGGGIIVVPGLVFFLHYTQRLSHGTSLLAILPIAVSGVIGYTLHGSIALGYAAFLGLGSIAGALIGTKLLSVISNRWLARGFSALLIITAVRLFVDVPVGSTELVLTPVTAVELVAVGVVVGTLAGLLGIGGGIVLVPILVIFFGAAAPMAKGTALLVAIIAGATGSWRNYRSGNVDIAIALKIGIAGVPTAFIGAQLAIIMSAQVSMILFAGLLVLSAVRLLRSSKQGECNI
jgi:uncharacterized protein